MEKILILSVFPAPYRVGVFSELQKKYNIKVYFERIKDENRNKEWFSVDNELKMKILDNRNTIREYKNDIRKLSLFDVVLVYDYSTFTAIKLMLKCIIYKVPYIINCDGAFINSNHIKNAIKRFFIKNAKGCFASGYHAEKYFLQYGAKKENIYKHNFSSLYRKDILKQVMTDKKKNILKKSLGISQNRTVITVGQFIYRKGFDVLLNAWKNVSPNYNLIIIGGGEKEQEYINIIRENKFANVLIVSYKPFNEILRYLRAADLFVLPTREDVWGLVINEAMACGLPVITTNSCIAGMELVENYENGFIVPVENDEDLSEKINIIMEDELLKEKMSKANLKKISEYTIENIAENHIEALEKILENKK